MKEYLTKRHCTECTCENCGQVYLKPDSEIKRNLKLGRKSFCSIGCAIQYRENNTQLTEKQKQNRENFKNKCTGLKGNLNPSRQKVLNDPYAQFKELFRRAKMHCSQRKDKREFSITLEDLKQQWEKQHGKCAYTNVELILPFPKKGTKYPPITKQASLDRIDSSKGYIPGNIQFVCSCINFMKSTLSDLEVKRFLKEISSYTSTFIEDETISSSQNEMSDAQAGN